MMPTSWFGWLLLFFIAVVMTVLLLSHRMPDEMKQVVRVSGVAALVLLVGFYVAIQVTHR